MKKTACKMDVNSAGEIGERRKARSETTRRKGGSPESERARERDTIFSSFFGSQLSARTVLAHREAPERGKGEGEQLG
jgi:hypothetical protein